MQIEYTDNQLFLFKQDNYKHHLNNAIRIYCQILRNRNVTKLDRIMMTAEVFGITDWLQQEWIDREKAVKKQKREMVENVDRSNEDE